MTILAVLDDHRVPNEALKVFLFGPDSSHPWISGDAAMDLKQHGWRFSIGSQMLEQRGWWHDDHPGAHSLNAACQTEWLKRNPDYDTTEAGWNTPP